MSHQWPIVSRIEAWRCGVKSVYFNFSYSPLRASIKVPSVLIIFTSTIVSPAKSARLSPDIPHVCIIPAISLPFIPVWVFPQNYSMYYVSVQLPCYTTCPTAVMLHCVHTAAMLHYVYIQLPCYTMCPYICLLTLCIHTAAMLHCVSTQLLCCTTFHKNITLRTFLQQCTTILHLRALK